MYSSQSWVRPGTPALEIAKSSTSSAAPVAAMSSTPPGVSPIAPVSLPTLCARSIIVLTLPSPPEICLTCFSRPASRFV